MNKLKLTLTALAIAAVSTSTSAQQLEEVLVTATKREVGMQDVPISLSVMTGEKISEQGIGSLEDLALFMPNVQISEAAAGDQLFIRGVGSGVNYGFEQSVGTFIDGVYFGRGQASRSAFLDLARVEVLKGPQSTLFGKNTIAGAINITTAGSPDEFESFVEAIYEPEFDHWSVTGMITGPLSDSLSARLVVQRDETDGYMDNTLLDEDEVAGEDSIGRIVLDWQATDDLDLRLKYESGESERLGRQNMISMANDFATALYRANDPNFRADFGYDKSSANVGGIRPDTDEHNSEWDVVTLTAEWALGEHTVKSVTGFIDASFDNYLDTDFGPARFIGRGRDEQHEQFSQELLWTSPMGDDLEYLAGVYYQKEDLENNRYTDVVLSAVGVGGGALDATGVGNFQQDTETWSVFAQTTWHMSDTFRLIGGIRYSDDHKEFEKLLVTNDLFTDTFNPVKSGIYDAVLNFSTDHRFNGEGAIRCPGPIYTCTAFADFDNERDEDHVTGDITVQWDARDDLMLYAKIGNGYKAGGFDEDNARGRLEDAVYEDETAVGGEIGGKWDFLDGRGRLNVAAFYSEFTDVQVSTFDGNAGFIVGNAAETETKGLEFDGQFAVTDDLTLTAALAYLKAEYSDFTNAACNELQVLQLEAAGGSRQDCVQDLSGEPLQFAPEWSGNLALDYYIPLGSTMEIKLGLDAVYSAEFVIPNDQDPLLNQDSYWKLNGRIQLASVDDTWMIALLGRNLTAEETTSFGNDVPLAAQGFSGTYFQHIDAPRSYQLQLRYNFR